MGCRFRANIHDKVATEALVGKPKVDMYIRRPIAPPALIIIKSGLPGTNDPNSLNETPTLC